MKQVKENKEKKGRRTYKSFEVHIKLSCAKLSPRQRIYITIVAYSLFAGIALFIIGSTFYKIGRSEGFFIGNFKGIEAQKPALPSDMFFEKNTTPIGEIQQDSIGTTKRLLDYEMEFQ